MIRLRLPFSALIAALLLASPLQAANPFKYEEFGWLIKDMRAMMLEHCRKRGVQAMNSTGILGPLGDSHNFRRACGQGLHGRAVPSSRDWRFYYARLSADDADQDFFGVQRLVHWKGSIYSLVIATETRRQIVNGQTGTVETAPSIVLFQSRNDLWQPVWNYANTVSGNWNDPWNYTQDPDWTDLTIADLQGIKMSHILRDYPYTLGVIKDARGLGFP